ncbi:MAG: NfeD family protein [Myxococcales bacterium]|nr:NfeD family protein [Myxococcales bacterium]
MSVETVTWVWFGAGVLLMALELLLPGLISVFLGLGAVTVAVGRWVGLVHGLGASLITWFVSSILLTLALRSVLTRFVPGARERQGTDEDVDAFGEVVDVTNTVTDGPGGRVRLHGTTWQARTAEGSIPAGSQARIVYRDNTAFIVEAVSPKEEPAS